MRNLEFAQAAFGDLAWWVDQNRKQALKIIKLIQATQRDPFQEVVKPEKLKHD